jgi:hypothetical protein
MELGGSARSELGEEIVAASVPEVVDADGERWMYFVDGDLDQMMRRARANEPMSSGWRGIAGLGAAHLVDGAWERVEPQMNGEELPVLIADPDITRLPDGDWGMVTLAVPFENACVDRLDPADSPAPHRMWGWRSDDLVRWESQGVWWEAPADATDPGLWCRGEACGLVIARGDTPPDGARSDDGAHSFVAEAITGIDPLFVMPDVLVPNEGPLTLLGQGDMGVLRAFTSEDGWTWTGAEAPDFSAAGPTALLADDGWLFWMQVSDLPPSDPPV